MEEISFGALLRELREDAGKSMADVARHLEVSVPYLSDVERDRRSPLSVERILEVAECLDIDPRRLLLVAARKRRGVELSLNEGSSKRRHELSVALARRWPSMSEAKLQRINEIVEEEEEE